MEERFYWLENQGQRIASMLHIPSGAGPHPGVLMLHGFTGDKVGNHYLFVKTARALARAGFAVLRFDFRGSGESEGRFQDVTVPGEIEDALTVFRWFARHEAVDEDRLAVLGLSLGGCVAAHVAGKDPRVRALVLWSAVADLRGLSQSMMKGTPMPPPLGPQPDGTIDLGGYLLGQGFLRTLLQIDPIAALEPYKGPALIIHGTQDEAVPTEHATMYARALGDRSTLLWVEGADHTFNAHVWERFVIENTRDWLTSVLKPTP